MRRISTFLWKFCYSEIFCGMSELSLDYKIRELFKKFDSLELCIDAKKKGKYDKKILKKNVEELLTSIQEYFGVAKLNWGEIFFTRLELSQNLLSEQKVRYWSEMLAYYLKKFRSKPPKGLNLKLLDTLVAYLSSHTLDPDNSLIGLTTRKDIFDNYYEKTADGKRYRLREVDSENNVEEIVSTTNDKRKNGKNQKKPEEINSNVGKLAIWVSRSNQSIFVRIMEIVDDKSVMIYVEPHEKQQRVAELSDLLYLHKEMLSFLGNIKTMQKLVHDPIDDFFDDMTNEVKKKTIDFLHENELKTDLLLSTLSVDGVDMKVSIRDLPILNKMQKHFAKWQETPPQEFYDRINEMCSDLLQKFIEKPKNKFFIPTKNQALQSLKSFSFDTLAKNRLTRFAGNCETALDFLKLEKRLLMNGTKKKKLTQWWLSFIDSSCRQFLLKLGFDFSAIPQDYIENPPDDIELIKKNLTIISEVLNRAKDIHNVVPFIENLSTEIYAKIREFEIEAIIVLGEQFEIEAEEFSLDKAKEIYKTMLPSLDNVVAKWIDDMIKDIEYLFTMKEMEEKKKESEGKGLVLSNVVPVSGLILSFFFRKENELKTVLELWDRPSRKASSIPLKDSSKVDLNDSLKVDSTKGDKVKEKKKKEKVSKTKPRSRKTSIENTNDSLKECNSSESKDLSDSKSLLSISSDSDKSLVESSDVINNNDNTNDDNDNNSNDDNNSNNNIDVIENVEEETESVKIEVISSIPPKDIIEIEDEDGVMTIQVESSHVNTSKEKVIYFGNSETNFDNSYSFNDEILNFDLSSNGVNENEEDEFMNNNNNIDINTEEDDNHIPIIENENRIHKFATEPILSVDSVITERPTRASTLSAWVSPTNIPRGINRSTRCMSHMRCPVPE